MIDILRQILAWAEIAGQDRKISDTYRKGYSCPVGENFQCNRSIEV